MTDNTQELDDRQHIKFNILVPFLTAITIKRQKENGNLIKDTETAYYDFAVDLITAHTNAEIARTLDRLEQDDAKLTDGRRLELDIPSWVEAERAKLKEVK